MIVNTNFLFNDFRCEIIALLTVSYWFKLNESAVLGGNLDAKLLGTFNLL